MKKVLLAFLCVLMLAFTSYKSDYKMTSCIIEDNSKLGIIGSTNVSTFSCNLNFDNVNSKVKALYQKIGSKIKFQDAYLEFSNTCFDCGNKLMNKDFLEMLDTKNYPNITLDLKEITKNPKKANEVIALVNISLAGHSKFYSIWLNTEQGNMLKASGCLSLKLSDFNLEPPKKVLGLVVVEDAIEIALDLNIKTLE